ncbi:hypothetical protein C8J56DRAFT_338069 [Mycena floridula]|nr:hypothetical protein C8J56DRAFT_338069 [Mycena floridula]
MLLQLARWARRPRRLKAIRGYTTLLEDLEHRGYIQQVTKRVEFSNALEASPQVIYAGVDPTASSLHIGHLVPLMSLLHFQLRGHTIIPLIGGATGLVGDPSGRKTERQLPDVKHVEENVTKLTASIKGFFQRALAYAQTREAFSHVQTSEPDVQSNLSWHRDVTMLDFLQRVGIHARVNTMIARDSVRTRLESQQGISFTEFTYQLLQAYDFHHLHKHFGCTAQVGGSDQWGNIVAGLELITRVEGEAASPAYGFTTPLLTTASGDKFGKSAGNAIWLNTELTSVFDFYQYFLKVEDADVEKYLKLFTLVPLPEIGTVMSAHMLEPERRIAQRRLADEVTELVHQKSGLDQAKRTTRIAFDKNSSQRDAASIIEAFQGDPRFITCDRNELTTIPVMKLASKYGLVSSTSAARQLILAKGLYVNDQVVPEIQFTVGSSDLIEDQIAIVRAGKDKLIVLATKRSST